MEFNHTESDVMEEIKQLQATIPGLCYHGTHQAVSTGSLTPSCEICTRMAYMSFQLGFRCNAKCPFCFLSTYNADAPDEDEKYNRQALLEEFHRRKDELEGIALTGGEPLLYLPEKTLENVERARGMFEQVVVEVPSYPKQKEKLIGCLGELNRIGIDQLNLQELLVTDANVHRLEGEGYQSGLLFLKKFFLYGSRKMTYEVMRYCIDKKYSFTVNDCSAARFGRMP